MDFNARWDKILRDIWQNKSRSLLVVLTLAIGIAAVGTINNTVRIMKRDLYGQYDKHSPASITLYISPFPKELARDVESMRGVAAAQAQRAISASTYTPKDSKRTNIDLTVYPDASEVRVNRYIPEQGASLPALRTILLERNTAQGLGISVGDTMTIEMPGGTRYSLTVSGIIHDLTVRPYSVSGNVQGYISMATLEWMGEKPYYNQLQLIIAGDNLQRNAVLEAASQARDRVIEPAGYQVAAMNIAGDPDPGDFWAKKQVNGVLLVFQLMSVLSILLSGGLVINTISAVLIQQTKQIGIMRSIGASRWQIVRMYLSYVLVLSLLGLVFAIPLGMLGTWGLVALAARLLNFTLQSIDLSNDILLMQVGLGLLMPLVVALYPILNGTRISIYDAIYQFGLGKDGKKNWFDRQLVRLKNISPPVMLSLRNTFRNKSRLAFTIATLTIAGAMFMAVFSSYSTIHTQIDELGRYFAFDASLNIPGGANKHTVEREARRLPEIKVAEGWASANGYVVHPDGSESDRIELVGLPSNAQTIEPLVVSGRWLQANDTWQVVVNEDLLNNEPSVKPGNPIVVKINGVERNLTVVGVASIHMMGSRIYMNYDQLTRLTGRHNQVDVVRVLATPGAFSAPAKQSVLGEELEKRFEDAKLSESTSRTRYEIFAALSNAFNIMLIILLAVAVILAIIGGLGLTGAMGLNVLERTREIGVLRAVGASHHSVRSVVVVEGTVVALISWFFSALLSYPAGWLFAGAVVQVAFSTTPNFQYSLVGLFAWLAVVLLIGVFSSLAPARNAARLTVREVLNYE